MKILLSLFIMLGVVMTPHMHAERTWWEYAKSWWTDSSKTDRAIELKKDINPSDYGTEDDLLQFLEASGSNVDFYNFGGKPYQDSTGHINFVFRHKIISALLGEDIDEREILKNYDVYVVLVLNQATGALNAAVSLAKKDVDDAKLIYLGNAPFVPKRNLNEGIRFKEPHYGYLSVTPNSLNIKYPLRFVENNAQTLADVRIENIAYDLAYKLDDLHQGLVSRIGEPGPGFRIEWRPDYYPEWNVRVSQDDDFLFRKALSLISGKEKNVSDIYVDLLHKGDSPVWIEESGDNSVSFDTSTGEFTLRAGDFTRTIFRHDMFPEMPGQENVKGRFVLSLNILTWSLDELLYYDAPSYKIFEGSIFDRATHKMYFIEPFQIAWAPDTKNSASGSFDPRIFTYQLKEFFEREVDEGLLEKPDLEENPERYEVFVAKDIKSNAILFDKDTAAVWVMDYTQAEENADVNSIEDITAWRLLVSPADETGDNLYKPSSDFSKNGDYLMMEKNIDDSLHRYKLSLETGKWERE